MYNLAIREGLPKIGDTPDHLAPNAYYLEEDKYWKKNVVPFLSTTKRGAKDIRKRYTDAFYIAELPKHIKGGSSLKSKAIRFVYKEDDTPGPTDYDPKKVTKRQPLADNTPPAGKGRLYVCRVPHSLQAVGPSIPTKLDENGYGLDYDGNLMKIPPDRFDTTLGPAFYDVPTSEPFLTTRKYKGCEWSKRRAKRTTIDISSNPGPGTYNLQTTMGQVDPRDDYVREMARLFSYVPRSLEATEMKMLRDNLPAPGQYDIPSTLYCSKWKGIKPPPFVGSAKRFSSEKNDTPSPTKYTISDNFITHRPLSVKDTCFGVEAQRFSSKGSEVGPGPAAVNVTVNTIDEKVNKKRNCYTVVDSPFNITAVRKLTFVEDETYFMPGPAEYLVEPLEVEKLPVKCCQFKSKTDRFAEKIKLGYVDPAAYNISETFNKSRNRTSHNVREVSFQSIGDRRLFARKFDTPGPGAYLGHTSFGRNKLGFQRSPRFKESTEYQPGPGAYNNWEDSMDQEETEEDLLTESASASGDGVTYRDIQRHTDMKGKDSNEIEATTESASANKEGGIEKSTDSNQKHFKAPVGGAKKNKRKAVDMEETNRRMEEAYEIMKQSQNTEPPKSTLSTAYGQLVAKRLETLSEVNKIIVMNEIDNLFFRATMGFMGPQYQSVSPGPASPASFYSSSSDETFHTTPSVTSSVHQPPLAPAIPTPTCNDISLPTENYTYL